jgi:hypothetical protein
MLVTFIKRSTGEERVMKCSKYPPPEYEFKGGKLPFNKDEKNVLVVWDEEKNGFRIINIEGLISVKVGLSVYICKD